MKNNKTRKVIGIMITSLFIILLGNISIGLIQTHQKAKQKQAILPNEIPTSTAPVSAEKDRENTTEFPTLTTAACKEVFKETRAIVIGDSMVEGLSAYQILEEVNVIWVRGRRIDNMLQDLEPVLAYQPNYLFLTYGENDLEYWESKVDKFIAKYKNTLALLQQQLPNTKIVVNSILPVSKSALEKQPAYQYQPLYNERLKELCSELAIPFLENSSYLEERTNPYSTDGVHPQPFYFNEWAKHMTEYLLTQEK